VSKQLPQGRFAISDSEIQSIFTTGEAKNKDTAG
jgi:hypothetical protein